MKKIKKPLSIVLALMMVVSLFAIVPITASAAEETSTVTWDNNSLQRTSGGKSAGGVTLTTQQGNTRVNDCFYDGRGSATFTAPAGSVFTKIELKDFEYYYSLNFPGATVAESGGYWDTMDPEDPLWEPYYTATWTGESSEVTFSGAVYAIQSIVFTLKSTAPPTYTVTWKNGETTLKTDTVDKDAIPAYSGDVPEKAEDANYTYTFSGWTDGTTTYGATDTLPAVTGDITYTATYTSTRKDITGSFGSLNWRIDADGVLTFSGSGALPMDAFNKNGDVKKVIINDSVTALGAYAFYECPNLTEVDIQNPSVSLEGTSNNFAYSSVTTVTLPEGMTTIPQDMFKACGALTTVDLPSTITSIAGGAFWGSGLQSISVPEGATYDSSSFETNSLRSLTLEGSSPKTFTGGEFTFLSDAATVYIPEGSTYVYSTTTATLYVKDSSNQRAQSLLQYAQEYFNRFIGEGMSPQAALAYVNDMMGGDLYDVNVTTEGPFTVTLNDGDKCEAVFGGATIGKYVPPAKLFPQHSVSLGGNIGVNFYIDPAAAGADEHAPVSVEFSWNGQSETVSAVYDPDEKLFKATCDVVAAEVACDITAVATVDGVKQTQTDTYSVQDYAEAVYNNPTAYDNKGKPDELKELAKALLNYGAMAQTVFVEYMTQPVKAPADIVKTVGETNFTAITADEIGGKINGTASDLEAIADQLGFKYYTSSVIYLQNNTLRLYFTPETYQGEMPYEGDFNGKKFDYYYYVDKANIAAAELDDQQTFTIGNTNFTFSALDYAKAVVESTEMEPEQQNLAKALYLYNQKANAYFDAAPAPAQKIVDLSTVTEDTTVEDGYTITGTLGGNYKITIADDATVTLKDANITCLSNNARYAGITPLGDATIMLEGENTVKGGYGNFSGVYVPADKTLTIDGTGSLDASSNGYGCGIGGGYKIAAGNIVINGGTITATGGTFAAGIGSGGYASCGTITITGGTITANGGFDGAGIGSGGYTSCGNITINGGTITATGGLCSAGIGSGYHGSCGTVTVNNTVTKVTATKGEDAPNSIGAGDGGSCGTVTIEDGANVIQN